MTFGAMRMHLLGGTVYQRPAHCAASTANCERVRTNRVRHLRRVQLPGPVEIAGVLVKKRLPRSEQPAVNHPSEGQLVIASRHQRGQLALNVRQRVDENGAPLKPGRQRTSESLLASRPDTVPK